MPEPSIIPSPDATSSPVSFKSVSHSAPDSTIDTLRVPMPSFSRTAIAASTSYMAHASLDTSLPTEYVSVIYLTPVPERPIVIDPAVFVKPASMDSLCAALLVLCAAISSFADDENDTSSPLVFSETFGYFRRLEL